MSRELMLFIFLGGSLLLFSGCIAKESEGGSPIGMIGINEGKIAYESDDFIHVVNPDGTDEKRLSEGDYPKWSPDGKKIAVFTNCNFELWVMNSDGSEKINLLDTGDCPYYHPSINEFSWVSNEKISFSSSRDCYLCDWLCQNEISGYTNIGTINSDGSTLRWLTNSTAPKKTEMGYECEERVRNSNPVISPDGIKIAYSSDNKLLLMNLDGSGKTSILPQDPLLKGGNIASSSWSPDGKKIVFGQYGNGIFIIDSDGKNLLKLTEGENPLWTSDGRKILYYEHGGYGLNLINPDGTNKKELSGGDKRCPPSFSPDGKKFVIGKNSEVWIVNLDGTGEKNIVKGDCPSWSP